MGGPQWRTSRAALLTMLSLALFPVAAPFLLGARSEVGAAIAVSFAAGALNGGFGLLLWSWIADEVALPAPSIRSFSFGAFTAASRLALAAGGLYVGTVLAWIDYRRDGVALIAPAMAPLAVLAGLLGLAMALHIATGGAAGALEKGSL